MRGVWSWSNMLQLRDDGWENCFSQCDMFFSDDSTLLFSYVSNSNPFSFRAVEGM